MRPVGNIARQCDIQAIGELQMATQAELIAGLKAYPVSSWDDRIDALSGRFSRARELAAKLLEPGARSQETLSIVFRPEGARTYQPGATPQERIQRETAALKGRNSSEPTMSQSLVKNLIHLVYSTKNRRPWIPESVQTDLYAYQAGIFKQWESPALVIGGVEDHLHALFSLSKNHALKKTVEALPGALPQAGLSRPFRAAVYGVRTNIARPEGAQHISPRKRSRFV